MRRLPAPVTTLAALLSLLFLSLISPHAGLAQPPSPILRDPGPGETISSLTFTWDPVPEANVYEIEIWMMQAGLPVERVWTATTHATTVTPRDVSGVPQGNLSWKVRAVDAEGRRSAWGQSQVVYEIGVPALLAPAESAVLDASQPVRFAWAPAGGAQSYQIDVATDPDFLNPVWSATTSDTSIIPPYPLGTGDLYWHVRGLAPGGTPGRSSPTRQFKRTVGTPQNLIGPDGATPTFAWDPVAGAAAYNIQVSTTADFSTEPVWEADTVNTHITPVGVAFGTQTRYWRVRARDAGGFTSPWADGGAFSLTAPGGVETLQLMSPEDGATLQADPDFRWQRVDGADHYVLEVAQSPAFDALYDEVETRYDAYTPFSNLVQTEEQRRETYANGTYYWRIRAVAPAGSDVVSEERRFTKAMTLDLLEPDSGTRVFTDPTFRWQGVAGARNYRILVSENPEFEPVWDVVELDNTSHVPFSDAAGEQDTYANGTYFWQVEALDSAGTPIVTSSAISFTKDTPVGIVAPHDGAMQSGTPTFAWAPVAGAYRYRLTVSTAPEFGTTYDQITTDATRYTPYVSEVAKPFYAEGVYEWSVEALDNLDQIVARSGARRFTIGEVTATRTPSPTASTTPSRTYTPSATPSRTPTPPAPPTSSPSPSVSPTQRPTHTPSPTHTAGPSPTAGFIPPSPTPHPAGRTDSDEPNDVWTLAVPIGAGVHQSYISHERDLDWFKIYIDEPGAELRVALPHPPADYDLALLSEPTDVDPSLTDVRDLADVGDVDPAGRLQAAGQIEDIGTLADLRSVRDISVHAGRESESVTTAALEAGWFYVLVKGYNGADSIEEQVGARQVGLMTQPQANQLSDLPRPYTLDVEIVPPDNSRRCTAQPPHPLGTNVARWVASDAPEMLILVNKRRMDAYFGSGGGLSEPLLQRLAAHPQVNGMIEPLETDASVAEAYSAWDTEACNPEAANRVTQAIKIHIDEVREVYPTLRQVLIIGGDDVIPFRRVPDETNVANESDYVSQVDADPNSPFYTALEQGYVLTDDVYADDVPLAWRGRQLFIPDRPVGRLVETPDDIAAAIESFLDRDGRLSLRTGFVLGYDFAADNASLIAETLRTAGVAVDSMIAVGWTSSDLRDNLLNTRHDVNAVNARFTHNEVISPDTDDTPLTAGDVAEVGSLLGGSLFVSVGSHAGLNVPDRWAPASDRLDFAQAFGRLGMASVANTGYGYGAVHTDAYSERLVAYFMEELTRAPEVTVGAALTRAKQRLFNEAGPASFGVYDEKASVEAALFGIPSLLVSVPDSTVPTVDTKRVTPEPLKVVTQDLQKRTIRILPRFERIDTPAGAYFAADDGIISQAGRPVQPRFVWDVSEPDLAVHGALLTDATYTEFADFDPVVTRPLTDTTGAEPRFPFNVWTPARTQAINRFTTADGTAERLVAVPAQFARTADVGSGTVGVERRFDTLTYDLYYSTSADWTPPTIWQVRLDKTALGGEFWVEATDRSGVQRVVITYTTGDGVWQTVELQLVGGFAWQALMPFFEPETLDFIAQAADGAGNVAVSTDKGRLFGRRTGRLYLPLLGR